MTGFDSAENLVFFGLLVAIAILLIAALALRIPYPMLLVIGGLGLGFVPGVPELEMPPELVLVAFLPPLLYSQAFFSSVNDLRFNKRPILLLATVLVLITTVTVAVVAHSLIADMSWEAAFVLGAIVSPTDPIAASAISRRLGAPRRVVTIVEGESLINDATALIAYRAAVVAVVTGSFSLWHAGLEFLINAVAGIAIGLIVGMVIRRLRRLIVDSPTSLVISLMSGYFAYLPAEALEVSAVLAVVTTGIYMGWHVAELTTPRTRLQGTAMWEILQFVLNTVLFVLIGMQLPHIVDSLSGHSTGQLVLYGAVVSLAVIVTRIVVVFPLAYLPPALFKRIRARDPMPSWKPVALVSWMGMRGAVSLAAALALPFATDSGAAFPQRDLIIFLAFCVILATLIAQGLSLPSLIRRLDAEDDDQLELHEARARIAAAEAALQRLDELLEEDRVPEDSVVRLRESYDFRHRRFSARLEGRSDDGIEDRSLAHQRLRRELINAERRAVVGLRMSGEISDEIMQKIQRDLDLEDERLDVSDALVGG